MEAVTNSGVYLYSRSFDAVVTCNIVVNIGCVQGGRTALHDAARSGHRSIVEVLVAAGADVATADEVSSSESLYVLLNQ